jgi:hypothetical protein
MIQEHDADSVPSSAERPWLYKLEELSPALRAVFARIDAA